MSKPITSQAYWAFIKSHQCEQAHGTIWYSMIHVFFACIPPEHSFPSIQLCLHCVCSKVQQTNPKSALNIANLSIAVHTVNEKGIMEHLSCWVLAGTCPFSYHFMYFPVPCPMPGLLPPRWIRQSEECEFLPLPPRFSRQAPYPHVQNLNPQPYTAISPRETCQSSRARGPAVSQILNLSPFYFWEVCDAEEGTEEMRALPR